MREYRMKRGEFKMEEEILENAAEESTAENSVEDVPTEREQMLEDKLFCIQNGVPEENCGVVIAAAAAIENPDRRSAITEVLERFPFFKPIREERSSITTGVHIEGTQGSVLSGVEEAFFAANPDCR